MNKLFEFVGGIANKGADYLIERERAKDAAALPVYQTPAERAVSTAPIPEPIVEGGKMTGTQSAALPAWVKPAAIAVGVSVAAGILVPVVKSVLKGSK